MADSEAIVRAAAILDQPLDQAGLADLVGDDRAGAVVTFTGVVRDHDHGRPVTGIDYVGHPSASEVIAEVAAEFTGRAGVHAIAVQHRVGTLSVGDLAVVAAVSASHRAEAFRTCSDLIDEIKRRLPIWKHQHFADGSSEWSNCP